METNEVDHEFRSAEERRAAIVALTQKETGIDEAMIETVIRGFYARVREDPLLPDDLPPHQPARQADELGRNGGGGEHRWRSRTSRLSGQVGRYTLKLGRKSVATGGA